MDKNIIVRSIVDFLRAEARTTLEEDSAESLEVAIQCIESAFHFDEADHNRYPTIPEIHDVFRVYYVNYQPEEAEDFKNKGNAFMLGNRPAEALVMYDRAVELDNKNAIYYCNRAAAYSKLNMGEKAVADCRRALAIDPEYAKAYNRLGSAYVGLKRFEEARDAFTRAAELDPANVSHKSNVRFCEEQMATEESGSTSAMPSAQTQAFTDMMSHMNFQQLMNNPNIINLATQVLENPQVQNTFETVPEGGLPSLASLVSAGHLVVQEMQSTNPELLENLRRMFHGTGGRGDADSTAEESQDDPNRTERGDAPH